MDHDEIKSLIPAYSLGAVDEDELRRIRDHILSCDECMAEADSYAGVSSSLALAVEPVPLPRGFENRVLAEVREPAEVIDLTTRRRWSPAILFGAAAILIAVVALAAALFDARNEVATKDRIVAALLDGDTNGIALDGDGGSARVIPQDDGSLFVATGLSDVPDDRTYQLWLMRGDGCPTAAGCELVSAGTFDASDGVVYLEIDLPVSEWDDSAVTIEPEGGSKAPTTQPLIHSFAAGT